MVLETNPRKKNKSSDKNFRKMFALTEETWKLIFPQDIHEIHLPSFENHGKHI